MTHVSDRVCILGLEGIHVVHGIVLKEEWPVDIEMKPKHTTHGPRLGICMSPGLKLVHFRIIEIH